MIVCVCVSTWEAEKETISGPNYLTDETEKVPRRKRRRSRCLFDGDGRVNRRQGRGREKEKRDDQPSGQ